MRPPAPALSRGWGPSHVRDTPPRARLARVCKRVYHRSMTNNTLPASVLRTIDGIAAKGGVDALLDYRMSLTKALASYRKTPTAPLAAKGIVTGEARIAYTDLKLAELTAK
ncbi:hypothetical protein SEA_HONK_73 [Microbacterium phage Honk]|uniref:Uncharacterized protein n=1 Tax=Microbacterium phage Honk TaxID=2836095 RepID=A0A8F3EBM4_9CAUD|nr:hypothetical protein SEA_HONK_73 [Microbacterium phage Honk]